MAYRYVQLGVGLLSVAAPGAMAHPKPHAHAEAHAAAHAHPQDYTNSDLYSNVNWDTAVDWNSIDYSNGGGDQAVQAQEVPQQQAQPASYSQPQQQAQQPAQQAQPAQYSQPQQEAQQPAHHPVQKPPQKPAKKPAPKEKAPSHKGGSPSGTGADTPSGSKAGLAYNDAELCQGFPGASWAYNWEANPKGDIGGGLEYVPMLHDMSEMFTSVFQSDAAGAKHVLGFNEPDNAGQANMAASQCASDYKNTFEKLAPQGARLGAPAVTSELAPGKGLDYLTQFMDACSDCKVDFICLHYYGQADQWSYFTDYIQKAKKFGKPIWVTEFGLTSGSDADQADFVGKASKYLQNEPAVERYAPFKVGTGPREMTSSNQMGQAFVAAAA